MNVMRFVINWLKREKCISGNGFYEDGNNPLDFWSVQIGVLQPPYSIYTSTQKYGMTNYGSPTPRPVNFSHKVHKTPKMHVGKFLERNVNK